ncbi:unnamed protein product [Sphagnum jensenii]|uniref:NB-ARC domain-containing protein n=1 Tax=Sphagnum jensenii TaxID=128206 RepID=A0ABP0W3S1_9BRYO
MGNSYGLKRKGVDLSQGPPKRKRDVVPAVIDTPLVPAEDTPSSSGWHSNVEYLVHDLNPTCNSNNPNLTIVFFHGITFGTNDEWKETWTTCPTNNREECICWPEKWLPEDLNNVRILSLSYDSNIVASVHNDVTEIGKNLIQSLITNSRYQSLWDGPVALVAYSFGGLVLKSLVVEAHKYVYQRPKNGLDDEVHKCCKTFLNNVKGVIFYGVPHSGGTQYLSKYFTWQCQQINTSNKYATQPSFSRNLEPFNQQMEYLSKDFKNAVHEDLNIYELGEGLPLNENWGILVPYVSAIQLSNNNHYKIEDANHLTICKPPNKDHPSYFLLLKCLRICMQKNIELPPLPCHEVALIDKAKDINILLQKESIVGLVGMGGIGKTTLSKKFYHLFHNQYDKSSFLEDVKSKDDINDVIKQLLHDLCGKRLCKDENVNQKDLDKIKQCMISKKVLVVVDDVGKAENLTSLQLPMHKGAKNATFKSKVLLNCRNWQILESHVSEDGKVVMKSLEEEQARELFMFHAFGTAKHVPKKDLKDICMKIIKACGGLPLSLKVLGAILRNTKELERWKGAFNKLKSGKSFTGGNDNEDLWSVLNISYDPLDKEHQNMFLDIACFLGGLKISTICRVWNGDYENPKFELQNLQHRSLIEQAEGGILWWKI